MVLARIPEFVYSGLESIESKLLALSSNVRLISWRSFGQMCIHHRPDPFMVLSKWT